MASKPGGLVLKRPRVRRRERSTSPPREEYNVGGVDGRMSGHVVIKYIPLDISAKYLAHFLRIQLDRVVERVKIKGYLEYSRDPAESPPRHRPIEAKECSVGMPSHFEWRLAWKSLGEGFADFLVIDGAEEAAGKPLSINGKEIKVQFEPRHRRPPAFIVTDMTIEMGVFKDPETFQVLWKSQETAVRVELELGSKEKRFRLYVNDHTKGKGIDSWVAKHGCKLLPESGLEDSSGWGCPLAPELSEYRLDFLLRDLEVLGMHQRKGGVPKIGLLFWIRTPPRVFRRSCCDDVYLDNPEGGVWFPDDDDSWGRVEDFTEGRMGICRAMFLVALGRKKGEVEELLKALKGKMWKGTCEAWGLRDLQQLQVHQQPYDLPPPLSLSPFPRLSPCFDPGVNGSPVLPFDVLYLLTALVQCRILPPSAVTKGLYRWLEEKSSRGEDSRLQCLDALTHAMAYRLPEFHPIRRLERVIHARAMFVQKQLPPSLRPVPKGYCRVRRLLITPLGAESRCPNVELPNRVLRHFSEHDLDDFFLRVSFTEEALDNLSCFSLTKLGVRGEENGRPAGNELFYRVLGIVSQGFDFCGRHFCFLASSASQMREQAAWFVADKTDEDPPLSVGSVLTWMGCFDDIKNVAKYSARLGQSFSAHFCSVNLDEPLALPPPEDAGGDLPPGSSSNSRGEMVAKWTQVPDVEREQQCFTDGIGVISPELAALIAHGEMREHLEELDEGTLEPTAFQVRFAGAKGVVAVWPRGLLRRRRWLGACQGRRWEEEDEGAVAERLGLAEGSDVHLWLRKSMIKFRSERRNLEIVNWGRFMPCYLNRQIITLLSTMGIPDRVFLDMQEAMVKQLDQALGSRELALQLLVDAGEDGGYSSALAMLRAGMDPEREPHLRQMLLAIRELQLLELKEKARIFVKDGRWLVGVVDEIGVLEYGECFVQVSDPKSWGRTIAPWIETTGMETSSPGTLENGAAKSPEKAAPMSPGGTVPATSGLSSPSPPPHHTPLDSSPPAGRSGACQRAETDHRDSADPQDSLGGAGDTKEANSSVFPGESEAGAEQEGVEDKGGTGCEVSPKGGSVDVLDKLVVEGRIVFGKNPCLHPGDLRILEAVDRPEVRECLGHLVNCVVLPQKGPRSHCSEASGSDLDGDVYFVSWDKHLVPRGKDHEPMDYAPEMKNDEDVRPEDVHKFFVDQMLNVNVGIICNAHVVHADMSDKKAACLECIILAKEAAKAIDFPKTGVPGSMPPRLRPLEYPDFMDKEDKPEYKSNKVLGELYRRIKGVAESAASVGKGAGIGSSLSQPEAVGESGGDTGLGGNEGPRVDARRRGRGLFRVVGPTLAEVARAYIRSFVAGQKLDRLGLEMAREHKMEYDRALLDLMYHHNIASEAELLTNSFVFLSKMNRGQASTSKEMIKRAVRDLRRAFRHRLLHGEVKRMPRANLQADASKRAQDELNVGKLSLEELAQARTRAAAWYHVTYSRDEILAREEHYKRLRDDFMVEHAPILLSFAWIGLDLLGGSVALRKF